MNAPGGNSVSVAEHTVALLLALARQVADASQSTRGGKWEKKKFAAGRELLGKTLGVVGTGTSAPWWCRGPRRSAMKVIAYDPFLSEDAAAKLGVELVQLPEIFRRSDAITLHVPLNEQTRNMVAAPQIAQMKPGALLINCARGGLVDEKALASALKAKRLGGAALDVFEIEPPPARPPAVLLRELHRHPAPGRQHGRRAAERGRDRLRGDGRVPHHRHRPQRSQRAVGQRRSAGAAGAFPQARREARHLRRTARHAGGRLAPPSRSRSPTRARWRTSPPRRSPPPSCKGVLGNFPRRARQRGLGPCAWRGSAASR